MVFNGGATRGERERLRNLNRLKLWREDLGNAIVNPRFSTAGERLRVLVDGDSEVTTVREIYRNRSIKSLKVDLCLRQTDHGTELVSES